MQAGSPGGLGADWSGSPPRAVGLTPDWKAQFITWFLIIATFAILGAWAGTREGATMGALYRDGALVTGEVVGRHVRSYKGNPRYYVTYEYEVRGARHWREDRVAYSDYAGLRRGQPITVTYLRSDPGVSVVGRVHEEQVRAARQVPWPAVALPILSLVAMGVVQVVIIRRRLALARCGVLVTAKVVQLGRGGSGSRSVTYEFATPDGRVRRADTTVTGPSAQALDDGGEVPVLYDPDRPARSELVASLAGVEVRKTSD